MYTLYKFHFLNGISEINQLFDDILIIWPAPVYIMIDKNQVQSRYVDEWNCIRDRKDASRNELLHLF